MSSVGLTEESLDGLGLRALPSGYSVVLSPSEILLNAVFALRATVWQQQAAVKAPVGEWSDEFDTGGTHWAVLAAGVPVAAVRMTLHDELAEVPDACVYHQVLPADMRGPIASYNRMVVHPEHRGLGLARLMDELCLAKARSLGARYLLGATGSVSGNRHRIDTMVRLGFRNCGFGNPYPDRHFQAEFPPTVLVYDLYSR